MSKTKSRTKHCTCSKGCTCPPNCTCKKCKKNKMMKKAAKKIVESNLNSFINQITQKNYRVADKYLQSELDMRIKAKIRENLLKP